MKTYVLAVIKESGTISPVIFDSAKAGFVSIGDELITNKGTARCLTREQTYDAQAEDDLQIICDELGVSSKYLPKAKGRKTVELWEEGEVDDE